MIRLFLLQFVQDSSVFKNDFMIQEDHMKKSKHNLKKASLILEQFFSFIFIRLLNKVILVKN